MSISFGSSSIFEADFIPTCFSIFLVAEKYVVKEVLEEVFLDLVRSLDLLTLFAPSIANIITIRSIKNAFSLCLFRSNSICTANFNTAIWAKVRSFSQLISTFRALHISHPLSIGFTALNPFVLRKSI